MSYTLIKIHNYKDLLEWDVKRYLEENIASFYPLKPLSTCIKRVKQVVELQQNQYYKQVTIKLHGKGISLREIKQGKQIKTKGQYLIRKGQLLCSAIDARQGAFGIVPKELDQAIITNSFYAFNIDTKQIAPRYLLLICTSPFFTAICEQKSCGTTGRNNVPHQALLSIKIPIPPLAVQKAIVNAYHTTIEKANKLEKQAQVLQESIQGLLANALGIQLPKKKEAQPKKYLIKARNYSFFTHGWSIHNSSLQVQSSHYPIYPIKKLCKVKNGATPKRAIKAYYENGHIPWIKSGELEDNIVCNSEEKVTKEALKNSRIELYPINSLAIAIYGSTIGKTAKLGVEAATNQACAILLDYDKRIMVDYLWFYLQSQTEYLKKMAYGSAQPNLTINIIREYPIPLPPLYKQKEIVNTIKQVNEKIAATNQKKQDHFIAAKKDFHSKIFCTPFQN